MANHVSNYITVVGTEAVVDKFAVEVADKVRIVERSYINGNTFPFREHLQMEEFSFMPKYDEDDNYNWYCNNVGAKWAHIEDGGGDYINVVSAWSPVSEFCGHLVEYLGAIDPNVVIRHQYEDEFRNFVGIQIFWYDDELAFNDHAELQDSDLDEVMLEKFPEWNDDDFDIYDYHEKYDCVPGEVLDDFVWEWMDEEWKDLYSPFQKPQEEKEGSFYGYNEKNDSYVHGLDD